MSTLHMYMLSTFQICHIASLSLNSCVNDMQHLLSSVKHISFECNVGTPPCVHSTLLRWHTCNKDMHWLQVPGDMSKDMTKACSVCATKQCKVPIKNVNWSQHTYILHIDINMHTVLIIWRKSHCSNIYIIIVASWIVE